MKSRTAATPFALWMAIFTIVPMMIVLWFAFTDGNGGFTMDNIGKIWQYAGTYVDSIWMGGLATVICLVLAYPIALSISQIGAYAAHHGHDRHASHVDELPSAHLCVDDIIGGSGAYQSVPWSV